MGLVLQFTKALLMRTSSCGVKFRPFGFLALPCEEGDDFFLLALLFGGAIATVVDFRLEDVVVVADLSCLLFLLRGSACLVDRVLDDRGASCCF